MPRAHSSPETVSQVGIGRVWLIVSSEFESGLSRPALGGRLEADISL